MGKMLKLFFYGDYDFWKENNIKCICEIENSPNKEEIIYNLYFKK